MTPIPTMRSASTSLDEALLRGLFASLVEGAREHRFEVAPNPCVGAAVLSEGREVARGYHRIWGQAHAEIEALRLAGESGTARSEWDTLVVTLEPCSTQGKTPPCTEAIVQSGIRRVVVGAVDPDPRHRGRGIALLRDAGLEVHLLEGASPVATAAAHFAAWTSPDRIRRARPWTIAKWAQTRSGHLTPPPEIGGGRWISGPVSLDEVHRLRGRVDAILTGVTTVLADDPRFSVRPPGDASKPPLRVVLDSVLRTPPQARLFAPAQAHEGLGELHILCVAGANPERHRALEAAGARITGLHVEPSDDRVNLWDVQNWLWQRGVRRVLLEAGPLLLSRYLQHEFIDQLRVYTGSVNGGRGESMGPRLAQMRLQERLERELAQDSVLEAFLGLES